MASSAPKIAGEPFADPRDADLVIRTCDRVDFYVHKVLLSLVSPVFKDMFSLAQPEPRNAGESLPFIDISETSDTLYNLLSFIDPRLEPVTLSFEQAYGAVVTAEKYQMDVLERRLPDLSKYPLADPLEVYFKVTPMVLVRKWAESLAQSAATAALRLPMSTVIRYKVSPEQAIDMCRLIQFYDLCGEQAARAVLNMSATTLRTSFPAENCRHSDAMHPVPTNMPSFGEWPYLRQYKYLLSIAIVRKPLGIFSKDNDLAQDIGIVFNTCLQKNMKSSGSAFRAFNTILQESVRAAVSKVHLGFSQNSMPFVEDQTEMQPDSAASPELDWSRPWSAVGYDIYGLSL